MKFPLEGVVEAGLKIIDKVIPDPAARDAAKLALYRAEKDGELEEARLELQPLLAQIELNKIEAASAGIYKGGWRPAIGWVCAGAIAWHFALVDLLTFMLNAAGLGVPAMPGLDIQELLGLVTAMLGIAGYRTLDKKNGTEK